jgi:hypothetical protein
VGKAGTAHDFVPVAPSAHSAQVVALDVPRIHKRKLIAYGKSLHISSGDERSGHDRKALAA